MIALSLFFTFMGYLLYFIGYSNGKNEIQKKYIQYMDAMMEDDEIPNEIKVKIYNIRIED